MCFHFFYAVKVDTVYQKVLYSSCLFLFYVMEFFIVLPFFEGKNMTFQ